MSETDPDDARQMMVRSSHEDDIYTDEPSDSIILIMGTFNPPTRAHIAMSRILHERYPDAQIIYVPSGDAYLKSWKHFDDESIPDLHLRAQLLRGAIEIEGGKNISVSEIEGDASKTDGKTYNTASYFQQTIGKRVAIAIGSDQLDKFGYWYRVKELVTEFEIIIFCRGISVKECRRIVGEMFGYTAEEHFVYIPFEYEDISSTKIREAWMSGDLESVKDEIPENVYEYLKKHGT